MHPLIKVTVLANVKPLPEYVKRITTANVSRGEPNGGFQIWPTGRPVVTVEAGERFAMALRIRALDGDAGSLKLAPDAPGSCKLRREANGDYWLDIQTEPAKESTSRVVTLVVSLAGGRSREIRLPLTVNVPPENFVVTPLWLDFGELNLSSATTALKRLGLRKIAGSFHIKSMSSTLPFLKLEQVVIIADSNYLIRVTINPTKAIKTGAHDGLVVVETDDGHRVEVPVKVSILP